MLQCCAHCQKPNATSKCSGCRLPYYCNKSCQASHWKSTHKKQCKFLRKENQLDALLESVKSNHVTLSDASVKTREDERKVFKKHNQCMQDLLNYAKKIQRCNTLSSAEKLSQSQKIADAISEYHYAISSDLERIPSELFANNDNSLFLKSSLKKYRPSKELITTIVSDIHCQRLKLNDAMNVMVYTMHHNVTNANLNLILDGLNCAFNNIDLKSDVFCKDKVSENKEAELEDIDKLIQYIDTQYFIPSALLTEHRPKECSDLVRFDRDYKVKHFNDTDLLMHGYIRNINPNKYIVPTDIASLCKRFCDTIINGTVYAAKLEVLTEYKYKYGEMDEFSTCMIGSHYGTTYNMDCAGNLFAFTGAEGYKARSGLIEEFCLNPSHNYQIEGIRSGSRGFSSPSKMVFCDNIYNTIWTAGDNRIKCSGVIENGKDTAYEEYEISCDHVLSCKGIKGSKTLFTTDNKVFVYSDKGVFYAWEYDKLNEHCTDIMADTWEDDSVPKLDEYGIKTVAYEVIEAGPCEDRVEYEVSGGQCYMETVKIDTECINNIKFHNSQLSIYEDMNKFGSGSSLWISNGNVIYKYNMKKNKICGTFLGHNTGCVQLALRQYLLEDSLMVSHDYGLVKVWDIRTNEAVFTIHASGDYKLMTAIGFGNNYIASGGGDEAVTVWDLRYQNALYEISAGNNTVQQIVWHKAGASLIAASDTGLYSDYWGNGRSDYEEVPWPKDAVHQKTDFPKQLDSNYNDIFVYKFSV